LHLRQGGILGAEPGLCAAGVRIVLLTLRERLIVVIDAAGGDRILRGAGERKICRDLIVRLRQIGLELSQRREELCLIQTLSYAHWDFLYAACTAVSKL
jgi:hypothetical protein